MKLLEGKVAVVTGAGSGVGRGVAIALARAGARTVVSSRTVAKCQAVVDEIAKAGGEATAVEREVSFPDDVDTSVAQTLERYGGIDDLVNAADDPRVDVPFQALNPAAQLLDLHCWRSRRTPQVVISDWPGSRRITPCPLWKAFGGQVMGSVPSPSRRRERVRVSPV